VKLADAEPARVSGLVAAFATDPPVAEHSVVA